MAQTTTKRTRCDSAVSSDDGDEGRSRSGSPSQRARQEPDSKRERHLWPPLPDDRVPRGGLSRLVVKGTTKTTKATTSPMSFYNALNNANAVAEAERDAAFALKTPALPSRSHPKRRKMREVMRAKGYCCVYPGRSSLRTMAVAL
jgi:hypothetical protein